MKETLYDIRRSIRYTQADMASVLAVSLATIQRAERDNTLRYWYAYKGVMYEKRRLIA